MVGLLALIALTVGLLRALWRTPAPGGQDGLLAPGVFPALLAMQIVWFLAWIPGMEQGIITGLAVGLVVARGRRPPVPQPRPGAPRRRGTAAAAARRRAAGAHGSGREAEQSPVDAAAFGRLLGDGHQFGISISYAVQAVPDGLAQAFVIGRDHIGTGPVALVLGDNIFYGPGLGSQLGRFSEIDGGTIFAYRVSDPTAYGVVEFDDQLRAVSLEEKPKSPRVRVRDSRVVLL